MEFMQHGNKCVRKGNLSTVDNTNDLFGYQASRQPMSVWIENLGGCNPTKQ